MVSFKNEDSLFNQVIYLYSNHVRFFELFIYSLICFALPIVLSHPQLLVGTVVNAILILTAHYLKGYEVLPAILLPSIGVLAAGVLFASITPFVLIMVPFIWLGNASVVYLFKKYRVVQKKNYFNVLGISTLVKGLFLTAVILLMASLSLVPSALIIPFSALQFLTLFLGGLLAGTIIIARKKVSS